MSVLVPLVFALSMVPVSASDEEAIKAVLVDMWDAVEKGDIQRYQAHIHPDFSQFGENDTYLAEGKELEVSGMADYMKRATGVATRMHQPKVTIKGDVAWITYYWTDAGMAGEQRFTSRGKSTRILVKENGRWLVIHGHYTAVQ